MRSSYVQFQVFKKLHGRIASRNAVTDTKIDKRQPYVGVAFRVSK